MGDPRGGFSAARRLVDVAEAVRATPDLPRAALAELLAGHGERPADLTEEAFPEAGAAELRTAARRMAAVLGEVDEDRAAEALNALFEECGTRPRLTRHDGRPWHLHVDRGEEPAGATGSWPRVPSRSPNCSPSTGGSPGGLRRRGLRAVLPRHRAGERASLLLGRLCHAGPGRRPPPPETGGGAVGRGRGRVEESGADRKLSCQTSLSLGMGMSIFGPPEPLPPEGPPCVSESPPASPPWPSAWR